MVKASTQQIRGNMQSTLEKAQKEIKNRSLDINDRCDQCGSQAFVLVVGAENELMFCGHHYKLIENNDIVFAKLVDYMIEVLDERDKIK